MYSWMIRLGGYLIQQFENEKNNPEETAELVKIAEDDVYTINKAEGSSRGFDFGYSYLSLETLNQLIF